MLERLPLCAFKLSFETELGNGAWKRSLETELGNVSTWHRWIQEELLWSTRRRTRFRTHPAANAVSHTHTADRRFEAHRHTDTPTYGHTGIRTHRHTDTPTYGHTDIQTHRHTDKGLTKGTHGLCAGACAMAWVQRSRMKKNAFATYSTCSTPRRGATHRVFLVRNGSID